jgi:LeuA allosteric (dimerisation) domain
MGTETFTNQEKIVGTEIVDRGDIHYHEYRTIELLAALAKANFRSQPIRYLPVGASQLQSPLKRLGKHLAGSLQLRLFGTTQYVVAVKNYLLAVPVESGHQKSWSTVGVSTDVIEASWNALVDALRPELMRLTEAAAPVPEPVQAQTKVLSTGANTK